MAAAGLKLFKDVDGKAVELAGATVALERHLQSYIERNMEGLLGVRFLASEYYTGARHAGRIDSLGLDEDFSPVIVEYKRTRGESILTQGLYYLAWLRDHTSEFEALVAKRLGIEVAARVDWSSPRLICIAGDFTRYDAHAAQEVGRRVDLVRYTSFGDGLLALESLVTVAGAADAPSARSSCSPNASAPSAKAKTVTEKLGQAPQSLQDLYADLDARLLALGDVHSVPLQEYFAYRRSSNFACVKVLPREHALLVFLKVDPSAVELVEGWTRDVREIGHHGTGSLEVRIRSVEDLARAHELFEASYAA
ncbi:DUF5655 domain-containing protein [Kitasatospora sp. NPDC004669]|uniref:DUF5655 domain-containing protein n=1 Tax=Kitasatospora sp. NPDC004669 TaxID=3154555 RepID=UPI0033AA8399